MAQIFTNPSALEEATDNVTLSSKQAAESKRLKAKLDDWQSQKQSKIIAYVGRFGSGKSTTLKSLESTYSTDGKRPLWKKLFIKDIKPIWLNFEAWRYTDREQLWEGFAIEAIDRVKGRKRHTKTAQAIDGISGVHGVISRHPWISAAIIFIAGTAIASVLWWCLRGNTDIVSLLIIALLKYALPVLFVIAAFFGVSSIFQKKEPLRRVFELENELEIALRRLKRPLVVVAEDIDRAGDEGIVFLETLRSFIDKPRDKPFDNSVIVIAPQDITYMSVLNEDTIKGIERGVKIYDAAVYYGSSTIQNGDTTKLLDTAGINKKYKKDLQNAAGTILLRYKSQLSLRMLKFIFREVQEFAESQDKIEIKLTFFLIVFRYLKVDDVKKGSMTLLEVLQERPQVSKTTMGSTALDHARNFIFDRLAELSTGEETGNSIVIAYSGEIENEIVSEYKVPGPDNRRGYHLAMTLHERYLDLLN